MNSISFNLVDSDNPDEFFDASADFGMDRGENTLCEWEDISSSDEKSKKAKKKPSKTQKSRCKQSQISKKRNSKPKSHKLKTCETDIESGPSSTFVKKQVIDQSVTEFFVKGDECLSSTHNKEIKKDFSSNRNFFTEAQSNSPVKETEENYFHIPPLHLNAEQKAKGCSHTNDNYIVSQNANVINYSGFQAMPGSNFTSNASLEDEVQREEDYQMKKLNSLIAQQEELNRIKQSIDLPDIAVKFKQKTLEKIQKQTNPYFEKILENIGRNRSVMNQNESLHAVCMEHETNLLLQSSEFEKFITEIKNEISLMKCSTIEDLISQGKSISSKTNIECLLLNEAFPAYGYKSQIINFLKDHKVLIISSDCSYFFNIVAPVVLDSAFPGHSIFVYEPNDLACRYANLKIMDIMEGREDASMVSCVTDDELVKMLTSKTPDDFFSCDSKTKDFVAVLNIPLKRSFSLDLSLALLKDLLLQRENSRLLLLTSLFDFTAKYEKYFSQMNVSKLKVPVLLFPAKTIWKSGPSEDYKKDVVDTVLSIHCLDYEGDILAFLPSREEAQACQDLLNNKLQSINCMDVKTVLLQERSSLSFFKFRSAPGIRNVFLTTSIAEAIPLPSVQFVIDGGLNQEYAYDKENTINVFRANFCSKSKANLRKSLSCIYRSFPVCFRMYNKENYCREMPSFECPEILTLNPLDFVLSLFRHSPENALKLDFIEPLNATAKGIAVKTLEQMKIIRGGHLSPLGMKIVKLPLELKYSKFINQCMSWGYTFESIVIVAYFLSDLPLFEQSENPDTLQKIKAAKQGLFQNQSDPLSFLQIYKTWFENNLSPKWCEKFNIRYKTMTCVQKRVKKICHSISSFNSIPVCEEFNESSDIALDLTQALLYSFNNTFSVFSGHRQSGYRILSSSLTGFIHPYSLFHDNEKDRPQFLIFNKLAFDSQMLMIGITALDPELVLEILNRKEDRILDYEMSDVYDKSLVKKTIERVSVRCIKRILLGKKGSKLAEIIARVQNTLNCGSIVIEPLINQMCVNIYAPSGVVDQAVEMVQETLNVGEAEMSSLIKDYILELKMHNNRFPLEIQCSPGAKVESFGKWSPKDNHANSFLKNYESVRKFKDIGSSMLSGSCLKLTWVRRPCNGLCYVSFTAEQFRTARKLSGKHIDLLGSDVYVDWNDQKDNELLLSEIPPETRESDVKDSLIKRLKTIKNPVIDMKFTGPFTSSPYDVEVVKRKIQDICDSIDQLSDCEIVVFDPKDSDSVWKAYINLKCYQDMTDVAKQISSHRMGEYKIIAEPLFSISLKVSKQIFDVIKTHYSQEVLNLEKKFSEDCSGDWTFTVEQIPCDGDLFLLLQSHNYAVMQELLCTVSSVLKGEMIGKNDAEKIDLLFGCGGRMWLQNLKQRFSNMVIFKEATKQLIRIYGPVQHCHFVKTVIIQYLEEIQEDSWSLNVQNKKIQFMKQLPISFEPDLAFFMEKLSLLSAKVDLRNNRLILHGIKDRLDKAKQALSTIADTLEEDDNQLSLAGDGRCAVCKCSDCMFNLQSCGHSYCLECIQLMIHQSSFPIQCCYKDCNEDLSFDDIENIFGNDWEKMENLLWQSLREYIEENRSEIVHCPTPNCSMFFKKSDVPDVFACPLCQNAICTICEISSLGFVCKHAVSKGSG